MQGHQPSSRRSSGHGMWARLWSLLLICALAVAASVGGTEAAIAAPAQDTQDLCQRVAGLCDSAGTVEAEVPFWCQWVPPEWVPPECQGGDPGDPGDPSSPIENQYAARGPWAVTDETVNVPGASIGPVVLTFPTNLGQDGFDHPILTFAAGTGATVGEGDMFATHLASWGYVVAGVSSPGLFGEGQEADDMRIVADHLVAQNGDSSSVFHEKLDTTKAGVFGHSQGAAATILLMGSSRNADGLFASAAPLALPDRAYWAGTTNPDYSLVTDPIFFVSGANDWMTQQPEQTFFFEQVAGPAAKAAAVGKDHGGMVEASVGYVTGWFKYTLEGDHAARAAFAGGSPEIASSPTWTNWAAKNLP